jgi:hypothetical protein
MEDDAVPQQEEGMSHLKQHGLVSDSKYGQD